MIVIVDYQMGNLRSVQKGFEKVGFDARISDSANEIRNASKIVLPGVGAFKDAMQELSKRELIDPIKNAIQSGKPFLGICLGLQLLFDKSYEGGEYDGFGVIPGEVIRFDLPPQLKVPHMGWNQARILRPCPILKDIQEKTFFYFVHSYYAKPENHDHVAIETDYDHPFCAMVWRDNLYATQFHPEKSQTHGLTMLRNFAALS